MFNLSVTNNTGEVLDLSTSPNYTVYAMEGLDPPKATVNTSVNATSDGMKINSVKLESRNIVIYIKLNRDIEASRLDLYKYFPIKRNVKLNFSNDTRDVYIEGLVEAVECNLFTSTEIVQVSLICPQPYFNDVDILVSSFSDVSSLFSFPFSIDESGIELSAITTNLRKSIINKGDVPTGLIIELNATGRVVNPTIYNVQTAQFMRFRLTLEAGDKLTVNTNYGSKSVILTRSGQDTNVLGFMLPSSSWLMLESGDNVFTYESDSGSSNLQITFKSTILYGGV